MSNVTLEELRQIKGLGPSKAQKIADQLSAFDDPAKATTEDLAMIQGVSERIAKEVLTLVNGGEVTQEAKTPRRTRRKSKPRTTTGNGKAKWSNTPEPIKMTAGFVRKAARAAVEEGREEEGRAWAMAVYDLLDNELVPHDRMA